MRMMKIGDMKKGYFVGNFEPSIVKNDCVEISIKGAGRYTLDAAYYRKKDTTLIVILSGKMDIDGEKYGKGDALVFEPGELINLFALTNLGMLVIHFPGTKKDLHQYAWKNFEELDGFYNLYLRRLLVLYVNPCEQFLTESINPKEVTCVIQGYVDPDITKFTADSIRKYLPGAKIILSTWEECKNCDVDYDELIINDDPGACECGLYAREPIANNGNRQIVSTKEGIAKVNTKYTLKLRSDLILLSDDILKYMDAFPIRDNKYSLFKKRIIIGELFTRNDFCYHDIAGKWHVVPKPFHPSDWFLFGLTEDIKLLYENVDLIPEDEMANFSCKNPDRTKKNKYKYSWRYTTEQHIILGCIKSKWGDVGFDDWTCWNDDIVAFSEKVLMNNFTVLSFCQHKILNKKYVGACFSNSGVGYCEKGLMTNEQMVKYFERNE